MTNDGGDTPATELGPGLAAGVVAVSSWGAGTVITKHLDMDGLSIAVYRFAVFALLLGAFLAWQGTRVGLSVLRRSVVGGVALGIDVALFFSAVKLTTIATATVIGAMQPIVVGVVATRFFGERVARREIAWAAVAIAGVCWIVLASGDLEAWSLKGDLLAVAALFAWSGYFIASKQSRGRMTSNEFTLGTAIWAFLINLPLAFAFDQDLSWPAASDWVWLVVLIAVAGLIGHTSMNWSLVRLPLWLGSMLTLLIPVVSSALAWVWLGESLGLDQVAAMLVVLVALAAVVRTQTSPTKAESLPA